MNDNSLQITIRNAFYRCIHLLNRKGKEYAPGEDRLQNFKDAGELQSISPEQALFGMLAKHLVSLADMCRSISGSDFRAFDEKPSSDSQAVWEEKLTDAHNYLFLLEGLVKERYGWTGPEGSHDGLLQRD